MGTLGTLLFDNKPLLYDLGGRIQQWLDCWLPLEDLRDLIYVQDDAPFSRVRTDNAIEMPQINWPAAPRPKINHLYWPTGATRHAIGYFLAGEEVVEHIEETRENNKCLGTLTISDSTNNNNLDLNLQMYALPPIRVSGGWMTSEPYPVYLLPLVDERFWWQFRDTGDLEIDEYSTWDTLIADLAGELGVTIEIPEAVDADFLAPDPAEFIRFHDNAALALDAACFSSGRLFIHHLDGSYEARPTKEGSEYSEKFLDAAQNQVPSQVRVSGASRTRSAFDSVFMAGNVRTGCTTMPEYLRLICRKSHAGIPYDRKNRWHEIEVPLTSPRNTMGDIHFLSQIPGTAITIHTSAWADMTADDATCNNATELTALAEIIAGITTDMWLNKFSGTWSGIFPFKELGSFFDSLTFCVGGECLHPRYSEHPDFGSAEKDAKRELYRRSYTMAQSFPAGWLPMRVNFSQGETVYTEKLFRVTLKEDMGATTTDQAECDILLIDGTDTTIDANVHDRLAQFGTLVSGKKGLAIAQDGKYNLIQAECA